jgi:hypothetical protein
VTQRPRAAACLTLALCAGLPGAKASAAPALLPSPTAPLDATVPVGTGGVAPRVKLPLGGRTDSSELVRVDLDAAGVPRRVRVRQRLNMTGTGDFFILVPAPLRDVRAAAGSQAEPGLRRNAIVWQGFASRRRVLAADALLVPAARARALPLGLELRATVDDETLRPGERRRGRLELVLRLRNRTGVRTPAFDAPARATDVARVLDRIRGSVRAGTPVAQPVVELTGPVRRRSLVVDAPLHVRGEVRLPVASLSAGKARGGMLKRLPGRAVVRFDLVLGGGRPAAATVVLRGRVAGAGSPTVALRAKPTPLLPEPGGGGSWRAEAAGGRASGRELVGLAVEALLRLARVHQYESFLASPDPAGSTRAVYVYRLAEARTAAAGPRPGTGGGSGPWLAVALGVGIAVGIAALAVVWAHS